MIYIYIYIYVSCISRIIKYILRILISDWKYSQEAIKIIQSNSKEFVRKKVIYFSSLARSELVEELVVLSSLSSCKQLVRD